MSEKTPTTSTSPAPAAAPTLTFLGGAGTVTGSKYLIDAAGRRIMIDAGMFQGDKDLRLMNWDPFPVDPRSIDAILITHAHMDHTGYLPRLVKLGFSGPVWSTDATKSLSDIVLQDSAHLQEQDADNAAQGGYSKHASPQPLYTVADALKAMALFKTVDYGRELDLGNGIKATWYRDGHILGSSAIRVTLPGAKGGADVTVLFSGDLGRLDHPILRARETPPGADYALIESTYGDREHPEWVGSPHEALADAIRRTAARGGSVLVPAFAVDRTEILLKTLAEMKDAKRIPDLPVYVDSPMGVKALAIYLDQSQRDELRDDLKATDFINLKNVHEVTTAQESMALNTPKTPCILISSSGMATGGRVVHHLQYMLPDHRNTVVFTGYQAHGTRGADLCTGATEIKMYGQMVPVKADVLLDDGFSAHADQSELLDWAKALSPKPKTMFVVHGEEGAPVLAQRLHDLGFKVVVPKIGDKATLS